MYGASQHPSFTSHLSGRHLPRPHGLLRGMSPDSGGHRSTAPESDTRSTLHEARTRCSDSYAGSCTELIGRPIHFETGQFAGSTVRAELIEIQKADLGRKYARVDRRPLDPPPVVMFRLYQTLDPGTDREIEREVQTYDATEMLGLVCTVDLFPISGNPVESGRHSPNSSGQGQEYSSRSSSSQAPLSGPYAASDTTSPFQPVVNPQEVVHYVDNFPVTEGSKATNALVGATFIQPNLVEYQGKKVLVFVFADLAVKNEGSFILRYRVFDIYARPKNCPDPNDRVIMQAECYGGPFQIYSTKDFPGLQASTELTKHLARWGVRLNIRETERRRRKKGEGEGPVYTTEALKRKRPAKGKGSANDDDPGSDNDY